MIDEGLAASRHYGFDQPPLQRYFAILRRRWLVILGAVVITTLAAVLYLATATKVYESEAQILVTPIAAEEFGAVGLGVIREAFDPTRDVETAALLIRNVDVASIVSRDLRTRETPRELLNRVETEPVAQSSIVAITASQTDPERAQELANAFAQAAIEQRSQQLREDLDPAIEQIRERIRTLPPEGRETTTTALAEQLAALEGLRSRGDPTLHFVTPAAAPDVPASPNTRLSLIAGLFSGLLLGVTAAFALSMLDPRPQRVEWLEALGLSVLARIPRRGRSARSRRAFEEAFRFLRSVLSVADEGAPIRAVAVTSSVEKEGKTTTSYHLAMAAVEAGRSVLLVEADPYRPALTKVVEVLGMDDPRGPGLTEYLGGAASLEDVVRDTHVPGLRLIPSGALPASGLTGLLESARGRIFPGALHGLADLVIVDCAPVGLIADAVLIAARTDAVLFVVDVQISSERAIEDAVRRLNAGRARVVGAVVNRDTEPTGTSDAYYYAAGRNESEFATEPAAGARSSSLSG